MRPELFGRGHLFEDRRRSSAPLSRALLVLALAAPALAAPALLLLLRTGPPVRGVTVVLRLGVRLGVLLPIELDRLLVVVVGRLWLCGAVALDRLTVGAVLVDLPTPTLTLTLPVFPSTAPRIRGMRPALRPE